MPHYGSEMEHDIYLKIYSLRARIFSTALHLSLVYTIYDMIRYEAIYTTYTYRDSRP